jgi:glyoxylase-like metal-dependent hydrolase (beta-lactamase superfamily II)
MPTRQVVIMSASSSNYCIASKLLVLFALVTSSTITYAKPEATPSFKAHSITDNITVLSGVNGFVGGNVAILQGKDGVVMVDNGLADKLDQLNEALSTVTDKTIDYILNTHVHGDHTGNNAHFAKQGGVIIAHDKLRSGMIAEAAIDYKSSAKDKSAIPVISFSDKLNLHFNDETIRLIHQENAHTNGDSVIHFKDNNVIHTGDLMFNGSFPYIDVNRGGSIDGYIAALEFIYRLADESTQIIPGHGELTDAAGLSTYIAVIKDCRKIVADLIDQGKDVNEIVAMDALAKYSEDYSWRFITAEKMIRQVYASLTETALSMNVAPGHSTHGHHHH